MDIGYSVVVMVMIKFTGQLSPFRSCISMDSDGQSSIKFTMDAMQLAKVIKAIATFPRGKLIEITLSPSKSEKKSGGVEEGSNARRKKQIKTYR